MGNFKDFFLRIIKVAFMYNVDCYKKLLDISRIKD